MTDPKRLSEVRLPDMGVLLSPVRGCENQFGSNVHFPTQQPILRVRFKWQHLPEVSTFKVEDV